MTAASTQDQKTDAGTTRLPFATVLAEELTEIWGATPSLDMLRETKPTLAKAIEDAGARDAAQNEATLNAIIHHGPRELSAICLSGGGIRSATFSLGVLEGLAAFGVLDKFSYLSTVSGGGYIGSWLTAWIHRKAREEQKKAHDSPEQLTHAQVRSAIARVCDELAGRQLCPVDSPAAPFKTENGAKGVAAEAPAIVQLRRFSNYLAPQAGLFSADTWSLIATVLRNMILNWLVLIPLLMGALALPRAMAAAVFAAPIVDVPTGNGKPGNLVRFGHALLTAAHDRRDPLAWALIVIGFACCVWTVAFVSWKRVVELAPKKSEDAQRGDQLQILAWGVGPLCVAAVSLSVGWAWLHLPPGNDARIGRAIWMTAGFGAALMFLGWLVYRVYRAIHAAEVAKRAATTMRRDALELVLYVGCGAVGGLLLRLFAHVFDGSSPESTPLRALAYTTFAPPIFVISFLLAATILVGVASWQMSEMDREWWSRFGAWSMIVSVGWTAICIVVLLAPQWLASDVLAPIAAAVGAGSGIFTIFAGLSSNTVFKAVAKAALPSNQSSKDKTRGSNSLWLTRLLKIALPTFVIIFAIALSLSTDLLSAVLYARPDLTWAQLVTEYLSAKGHVNLSVARINLPFAVVLIGIGAVMAWFISVNKFSLHAMYRNRLIRAYLGASRGADRTPDPFIGFDPHDDLPLCATNAKGSEGRPLLHVINVALNLVAGGELAWQERKAESMTMTALHAGTPRLGYRRASEYGGTPSPAHDDNGHAITLGTAMAISGAAASPNMGYHSSPMLTFLMTLFNARLGWWLGNPGPAGETTYSLESPRWSLRPLFSEAFGNTDEMHPYVYLSDGGHFENLGLYEMVRRRCRFILVVDAGADPACGFEDLSSAVRKIRSDLGISISIEASDRNIFARSSDEAQNKKGRVAMWGTIHYATVDAEAPDGTLLYIKPAFYGVNETMDVIHYAANHVQFPHETTADQFFSESQFESYRELGRLEIGQVCQGLTPESGQPPTIANVFDRAVINMAPVTVTPA